MSFFVLQSAFSLQKTGELEYKALTDDPRFVYRFWLRRPRYLVVLLEAADDALEPKLYADRGAGFDEETAIVLPQAGTCIYSISVSEPRRVGRIRIDPCADALSFRYWAACAWTEAERVQLIEQAEKYARATASIYNVTIEGAREKRRKRKKPLGVAGHFASTVELAERTSPPLPERTTQDGPFISFVVPVYNTPTAFLDDLLASFHRQPAGSAELILCDDGSSSGQTLSWLSAHTDARDVRIVPSAGRRGIALATNSGLAVARGEWVSLVDHDDVLSPCAVQLIAQVAREHPDCQFIYTDEVVTDEKLQPVGYFLKPAYDEVLLSGVNYINHLSCYRRERLNSLGGLRAGFDGSQDYDLLLRYLRDLAPHEVKHLPYPVYMWRRSARSFAAQFLDTATANARKALAERYRCGDREPAVEGAITKTLHRVRLDKIRPRWPLVSIVIPNRDFFC